MHRTWTRAADGVFRVGDSVVLRQKTNRDASPIFCQKLVAGGRVNTSRGGIPHEDIIGRRAREVVRDHGKLSRAYRLHEAKLDEYVRWSRRKVTPLYPEDIQIILGLMDIHVDGDEAMEILEAGTGHGALTLYLSRAVHRSGSGNGSKMPVIHSVERSAAYSAHAQSVVAGFRHGIYSSNIAFHVGCVSDWISATLPLRDNRPFLAHSFLDLPNADQHLARVAPALRVDGTLIVFNPSITQILECWTKVKKDSLPLELERVVELGVSAGSGGREWDVRAVRPRAELKMAAKGASGEQDEDASTLTHTTDNVCDPLRSSGWKMICRPKVGERIIGGGFVGVFRKTRDYLRPED
ncbi:S-adenosyl-L-methionine-dependent methyltransferase [Piedraia hortae CBS 480.64]|uniref:tRNA (adenine(58)-N(1))-methyltransferase catalytic subunit TRM61 n=1 Tax=Piedraia hortae CBS 480.64 TaxID=1314780 RepID=A0A6A7BUZ5_9PEZI|nr:S-adenosyl-L-methionine-dependent methyltransferase [Piedraia hortae CBS 480.64]